MAATTKSEDPDYSSPPATSGKPVISADSVTKSSAKTKNARSNQTINGDGSSPPSAANGSSVSAKRRCVSTACIACRKRKSKVCCQSHMTGPVSDAGHWLTRFISIQVRWQHPQLCSLLFCLWHRVHLRPQLRPSPQGRLQEGHRQSQDPQLHPPNPHPSHPQLPRE